MIAWEKVLEYGMGFTALVMMYSITFNHLKGIQTTLVRIETILQDIKNRGIPLQ